MKLCALFTKALLLALLGLHCGSSQGASELSEPAPHLASDAGDAPDTEPAALLEPLVFPEELKGRFEDLSEGVLLPFEVDKGEVSAEREPEVTFGVFADLNGGKSKEIILSGAVRESGGSQVYGYERESGELFAWDPNPLPSGSVSAALDLDGDGFTDLIMTSGEGMFIAWGEADGQYNERTLLASNQELSYDDRTTYQLVDLDHDGWLDILMNSPCDLLAFFRTGPRAFEARPEMLGGFQSLDPYAIGTWPRQGEAMVLLALGQPECGFYGAFEFLERDEAGYPSFEPAHIFEEPSLQASPDGMIGLARVAPMGSDVADLNGDGVMDLAITTDPAHVLIDGTEPWPARSLHPESGLYRVPSDSGLDQVGWGIALVDLDRDGRDDVLTAHGDDTSRFFGSDPSPGPQWLTAHLNGGDFRFLDVTEALALGHRGGYRALSVGDLDGDADVDIILGGLGEKPRVYRNDLETPNRALGIALRGTTSNAFGVGAFVQVEALGSARVQHYVVGAMASPKVISAPTLLVGIADAPGAKVNVHWPSGVVQVVEGLIAGQTHLIEEPDFLTISPANRHVALNESATLTLRAQSSVSSLSAEWTHGDGSVSEPSEIEPGLWSFTLTPPPTPGSARLEIRLNGEPLPISPRLWWDEP